MDPVGYLIFEGVRRSVVARDAGRPSMDAIVIELGKPDSQQLIDLADLYTTKSVIPRDHRYILGSEYPLLVLGTEPPRIIVRPLYNANALTRLTAIANVRLT